MRICVIAGAGALPKKLIDILDSKSLFNCLVLIASQNDGHLYKNHPNKIELELGKVGAALDFCKTHDITHIVFAGAVKRPNLLNIIPDFKGTALLAKILSNKLLGDDSLLKIIVEFVKSNGFDVLSPSDIIAMDLSTNSSWNNIPQTKISANEADVSNIEIGARALKIMSALDIGQALIIEAGQIIAVEGIEGTDELIKRSKHYIKNYGILVKIPKINQARSVDMPVIGPNTIDVMAKNNIKGLAIDREVIILEQEDLIRKADKFGIFLYLINLNN
ncbi:MAG: UDP-2,3-diacylglucosamine diphosphatase LpxI [Rickettsiaceae bacterium]|nr:UDP-2,3-diacylglucosamine diphosphatase LpxI [Rickettsiaceae bacterium]